MPDILCDVEPPVRPVQKQLVWYRLHEGRLSVEVSVAKEVRLTVGEELRARAEAGDGNAWLMIRQALQSSG